MTAFVRAYLVTILKALVLSSLIVAEYWFLELGFCAIICGMWKIKSICFVLIQDFFRSNIENRNRKSILPRTLGLCTLRCLIGDHNLHHHKSKEPNRWSSANLPQRVPNLKKNKNKIEYNLSQNLFFWSRVKSL